MRRDIQGRYHTISSVGEKTQAFIPAPLPPTLPIEWSTKLREKFDSALLALGRLDSVSTLLPDTSLYLYMYIRKEAVLSSMIEGTQSSLSDLLLFEFKHQPGVPSAGTQTGASRQYQTEYRCLVRFPFAGSRQTVRNFRLL